MAITMAELNQALEKVDLDIEDAIARGDTQTAAKLTEDVRKIADFIYQSSQDPTNKIPDMPIDGTQAPAQQPTFGDKVKGTLQTAGTLLAGATGGTVGHVGGAIGGLAASILSGEYGTQNAAQLVQQAAMEGSERGTKALYDPQYNQVAQQQLQALAPVGDAMNAVLPLTGGMTGASTMMRNNGMTGANLANSGAGQAVGAMGKAAKSTKERIMEKIREREQSRIDSQDESVKSMGAAQVSLEQQRADLANSFDPPIPLTKGMITRNPFDLREEQALMSSEFGVPLLKRNSDTRQAIAQNFDNGYELLDPMATDKIAIGDSVQSVLNGYLGKEKARIKGLYEDAEAAGELEAPFSAPLLVDFLNKNKVEAKINPILRHTLDKAADLGVIGIDKDGNAFLKDAPLKNIVLLRRSIGDNTAWNEPAAARYGTQLKKIIDQTTDTAGGELYKKANKERAKMGAEFDRKSELVAKLVSKRKNSEQQKIAVENVFNAVVNLPSTTRADLRQLRRMLLKSGDEGRQAWVDIQAETLKSLKNAAFKETGKDTWNVSELKPDAFQRAVTKLDEAGKLELLLGYQKAQKAKELRDLIVDIGTTPKNSINTSGTSASVMEGIKSLLGGKFGLINIPINAKKLYDKSKEAATVKAKIKANLDYQNRYKPQE